MNVFVRDERGGHLRDMHLAILGKATHFSDAEHDLSDCGWTLAQEGPADGDTSHFLTVGIMRQGIRFSFISEEAKGVLATFDLDFTQGALAVTAHAFQKTRQQNVSAMWAPAYRHLTGQGSPSANLRDERGEEKLLHDLTQEMDRELTRQGAGTPVSELQKMYRQYALESLAKIFADGPNALRPEDDWSKTFPFKYLEAAMHAS